MDVVETPEERRRLRSPAGIRHNFPERTSRVFRKRVHGHSFRRRFEFERHERSGFGQHTRQHRFGRRPGKSSGSDSIADRGDRLGRFAPIDRREDHEERVSVVRRHDDFDGASILVGAGRRDHVDRVADGRFGRQKRGEPGASRRPEFDDIQTSVDARINGEDARSACVGDDRHAPARWKRLPVETGGDVEHLVDRVGPDHAGLLEQRIDGDVARGQGRGVAAEPLANLRACDRLSPRLSVCSGRCVGRCGQIVVDFRTTRDTRG